VIALLLLALVRPVPASEPELPASKRAIECRGPDEAAAADHLVLRCAVRAKLPVAAVVLHYRPGGEEAFTLAPTLRSPRGWYTVTLCPHAFAPGSLHYYFEALDAAGKVVASSGDDVSPAVVRIVGPHATRPGAPVAMADEDPLADMRASREEARVQALASRRRGADRVFLGMGAGFGFGWYPASSLDFRRDVLVGSGTGAAGPVVLAPELGYQVTARLALSVLARWELIGSNGSGDLHAGAPARSALAVLGRGRYVWGSGRAQLMASAFLGGGDAVRIVVPPSVGSDVVLERNDSVRGGPVLLGPGAGFTYHFNPHLALLAELRALAGLPSVAGVLDFNTGLEVGF
jgi:hypothetical protein